MEWNEESFQEEYPNIYASSRYFTILKKMDQELKEPTLFSILLFSATSMDFLEKQIEKRDIFRYGYMLTKEEIEEVKGVIQYFMIDTCTLPIIQDFLKMTSKFDINEFNKLPDDLDEIHSYLFPRMFYDHISFYYLLNSMLLIKESITKSKVYKVLRVFNEYVTSMRNIQNPLHESYHVVKINELMKMGYSEEDLKSIQDWLLPTDLYKIWGKDYHPFYSIYELLDTKPMISGTTKEDFEEFMIEYSVENNVYFTGSSIMYILLNGIEKKNVNDVDIWYNSDSMDETIKPKNEPVFIQRFFQKTLHSNDVNHYGVHTRTGILDIHRENSVSIQFIHTYGYTPYMIIQTFDLPNVTAYFQMEDGKPVYALTTHFIESILHQHIYDFYNYAFVRKHSDYLIDKRLMKYHQRGFTLDDKLMNRVSTFQKNEKIETLLESRSKKTKLKEFIIPYGYTRSFFQKYFHFDFLSYNSLTPELEDYHKKYETETADIIKYNNHIFVEMFMDRVILLKRQIHVYGTTYEVGEGVDAYRMKQRLYQKDDYFFKKVLMIDYETGKDINPVHQKFERFPSLDFFGKYDVNRMIYHKDRILVNCPHDMMKSSVFNQEIIKYRAKYLTKHFNKYE